MSVNKGIDFLFGFGADCVPSYPNFRTLEQDVEDLVCLAERGKLDIQKLGKAKDAVKKLIQKFEANNFFYWNDDWKTVGDDALEIASTKVFYTILSEDIDRFNHLREVFRSIFPKIEAFKLLHHEGANRSADVRHDDKIQKIQFQFPYELSRDNSLVVVIDRDNLEEYGSKAWNAVLGKPYTYRTYTNDLYGNKWRSIGVPIGKRKITEKAESLQIILRKTSKAGVIVLKQLDNGLPKSMVSKILSEIQTGRSNQARCCFHFTNHMLQDEGDVTHFQLSGEKTLLPGDVVCLTKNKCPEDLKADDLPTFIKDNYSHYALYIGSKTYLSLYGHEGPLRCASLNAMHANYHTVDTVVIRLNNLSEK